VRGEGEHRAVAVRLGVEDANQAPVESTEPDSEPVVEAETIINALCGHDSNTS
jgi:hypothetical protein